MDKSKALFGSAESIVEETRKPMIASLIKSEEKKVSKTKKHNNVNNVKRQILPCNKLERQ